MAIIKMKNIQKRTMKEKDNNVRVLIEDTDSKRRLQVFLPKKALTRKHFPISSHSILNSIGLRPFERRFVTVSISMDTSLSEQMKSNGQEEFFITISGGKPKSSKPRLKNGLLVRGKIIKVDDKIITTKPGESLSDFDEEDDNNTGKTETKDRYNESENNPLKTKGGYLAERLRNRKNR